MLHVSGKNTKQKGQYGPVDTCYPASLTHQGWTGEDVLRICYIEYYVPKKIKSWGKLVSPAMMIFRSFIGLFCCKERDLGTGVLHRYIKAFPLELLQLRKFPRLVIHI